jgi:hypothetical protein
MDGLLFKSRAERVKADIAKRKAGRKALAVQADTANAADIAKAGAA